MVYDWFMSVKLSAGFLFEEGFDIFVFRKQFGELFLATAVEDLRLQQLTELVDFYDRFALGEDVPLNTLLSEKVFNQKDTSFEQFIAALRLHHQYTILRYERSRIHSGETEPNESTFLSLYKSYREGRVVVGRHDSSGRILGHPFLPERVLNVLKGSRFYLKEFGYQNSSDVKPEGVTDEDWGSRLKVWEETFPGNAPLSATGVSVRFGDTPELDFLFSLSPLKNFDQVKFADELEEIFSVQRRAKIIHKKRWVDARVKELGEPVDIYEIFRVLQSYNDSDYGAEVAQVEAELPYLGFDLIAG